MASTIIDALRRRGASGRLGKQFGDKRDMYNVLGYLRTPTVEDYWQMYLRQRGPDRPALENLSVPRQRVRGLRVGGRNPMSKHTPGPWLYDIHENAFFIFAKAELDMVADGDPDNVGIARIRGVGRGADEIEQEANAALIAAAPDLLEACKNLIDAAVTDQDACPICIHDITDHVSGCPIELIAEAIQKAEGAK